MRSTRREYVHEIICRCRTPVLRDSYLQPYAHPLRFAPHLIRICTHPQELGLDAFLEAYRILDDVDEDVDDDFVVDEMERILGQEKMGFIGLIHQLLISEEFIFHQ